jgi:uncharacterized protein (DUF1697 family)
MARFVAFVRGINVGGRAKLAMSDLRERMASAGLTNVRTLLASGNVVFDGSGKPAALEKKLEAMGFGFDFFVRTPAELQRVVDANPFPDDAKNDPSHLLVYFLKGNAKKIATPGDEVTHARGRELYVAYRGSVGTSKLTGAVIEKQLGTRATGRNWNTVLKVLAATQ